MLPVNSLELFLCFNTGTKANEKKKSKEKGQDGKQLQGKINGTPKKEEGYGKATLNFNPKPILAVWHANNNNNNNNYDNLYGAVTRPYRYKGA